MSAHPRLLDFWFDPVNRQAWFRSTPEFDAALRERFEGDWKLARDGELRAWERTPDGALALVILLDQVPLNIFRGEARAFSTEAAGRAVADRAIAKGFDREVTAEGRGFFYLPFMHSEAMADQDRSVALHEAADMADGLRWARHHREVVRRFGRFPHRNALLGRRSTEAELAWLSSEEAFKP